MTAYTLNLTLHESGVVGATLTYKGEHNGSERF